jgi:hypothetical protein
VLLFLYCFSLSLLDRKKRAWYPAGIHAKHPKLRECYIKDAGMLKALVSEKVPANTTLLIMNGNGADLDRFDAFPLLCKTYRCIRKEMFWALSEAPPELVQSLTSLAMIDAVIAQQGSHFFGNLYSTLSQDLYFSRIAAGQRAAYFNNEV